MLHRLSANGNGYASMNLSYWYKEGILVRKSGENAQQLMSLARKRGISGSWELDDQQVLWDASW